MLQYINGMKKKQLFNGGFMSLRKVDFSSINAILDEVKDDELYNVIGGCGVTLMVAPHYYF